MFETVLKLNLGRYEFQQMSRIGSTEMYLIWKRFGPTIISTGLIITTDSTKYEIGPDLAKYTVPIKMNISKEGINWLLMPKKDDQLMKH